LTQFITPPTDQWRARYTILDIQRWFHSGSCRHSGAWHTRCGRCDHHYRRLEPVLPSTLDDGVRHHCRHLHIGTPASDARPACMSQSACTTCLRKGLPQTTTTMLETHGPINETAMRFLGDLSRKIAAVSNHSNEDREGVYLFQRMIICFSSF